MILVQHISILIRGIYRHVRSENVTREFRFEGDEVLIRRVGNGVLLEPKITDVRKWFAKLDHFQGEFVKKGRRQQPQTPRRGVFD